MTYAFKDCDPDLPSYGDTEDSSGQRWNKSCDSAQSWLPRGPAGHTGSELCKVMHGCLWPATLCCTLDHGGIAGKAWGLIVPFCCAL